MDGSVNDTRLLSRGVAAHAEALKRGEYSSCELTRAYLAHIAAVDSSIGAFLTVDTEGAMRQARASDERRMRGEPLGALDGIPYAIKDNFCTRGLRTTAASRMLSDFVPPYDATVVSRLRDAGCVLLGKLNLDEFAMGSSGEESAFGAVRNPHDLRCVTGGSSSGSAAAVAALEAPFSIGSDTGGSIRQPAAFCGGVGFKPTYGLLSRYGMIAMASSLDCVGIVTRDATDAGLVCNALLGIDPMDATSCDRPQGAIASIGASTAKPLRVAVVPSLLEGGAVDAEVADAVRAAAALLRKDGAQVEAVDLPSPDLALAAYCVQSAAEVASNLARYDGIRFGKQSRTVPDLAGLYANSRAEGFGREVKRRILFGMSMLTEENRSKYYDRAVAAREMIRARFLETLSSYDLILTPTAPTAAFRLGTSLSAEKQRRADLCAVYANLAGVPAVSIPFGSNAQGLPLAVQLTAAPFAEERLLQVAQRLLDLSKAVGGKERI
ncbi:MAG: Asp-tRNA(Asn)/Glu-tRNA(Gln) amidotransferase subunit GatA [Ruminococcaceae bacterium]|nr:Asp-tRNA(Asn)/Glu-tRNA(Gln) amidotransferase subunit GatA [Oscillospiraceae bacterium]